MLLSIISFILLIILVIVFINNRKTLIDFIYELFTSKTYNYYVEDSPLDKNFKSKVINIITNSNWNNKYKIKHTDKNSANIKIYLVPDKDLSYLHVNKKYYPSGKQIRFSYTVNQENIYINADNWINNVKESGLTPEQYKSYVINHELGHALGYDHEECNELTAKNKVCPIMYQSTVGAPNGYLPGYIVN